VIITFALFVFWLSVLLMLHSYVLYPVLLKVFSVDKKENQIVFTKADELPEVFILLSVFNEEKVISEKLESILNTSYPLSKLKVYIGSDNSTDRTNEIVTAFAAKYAQIVFIPFTQRTGKPGIINSLVHRIETSTNSLFLLTDANVFFASETIFELIKHFKNPTIGLVAANVLNREVQKDGISFQEKSYIQREKSVKYLEGLNWGTMMGAFGACYALRATEWRTIPANYIVDDFYLSMNVLKNGKHSITEMKSLCYEDVSNEIEVEFNRKARIQAGNFQNLSSFWQLLFRFNAVSFCFLSHKVIRWVGPLFMLLAYVANICLLPVSQFYVFSFVVQNLLLLSPAIDWLFKKMGLHLILLRFASYFYTMNFALVLGFINYMKGIKTNTWNPTKRNV
jgi:cellulose synthase/poly-beta-1,6-N-acetylglucosamine synthase-like glycosyltransferase